jgi:hypothetical protein
MTNAKTSHKAIYASLMVRRWGTYAARRWCEKNGVPVRLFTIARQLEAAERGKA